MKQFILIILVLLPVCVFAQFNETFSGPKIDSENPWKGDIDKFVINSDGWLQLNAPKDQKKAEISIPLSYSENMEWLFNVRLLFEPTNQNCAKIYLYTDKHDIMDFDDDYYIQVGSNDRDISLRRLRETEKNPKKLIAGQTGLLKKADNLLHIKITLENNREWKLYVKAEEQAAYTLLGKCTAAVSPLNKGGLFKIQCVYSKTRSDLFYFDNINITSEITESPVDPDPENPPVEITLPSLLNIEPLSLSELQFTFDLPVDKSNAQFSITSIGNATSISYVEKETVIKVSFPKEMIPGDSYTITYSGLTDLDGNKMDDYSQEFTLEDDEEKDDDADEITPSSVLINEIMADPKGLTALSETEYIELYNTTQNIQHLVEYSLIYDNRIMVALADVSIPAHGYVVLYKEGRSITIDQGGVSFPLTKFPSQLANVSKLLQLKSSSGTIIDEVTYPKATPAKSWERTPGGTWQLSTDPRGGTPGSANSSEGGEPVEPEEPVDPDDPEDPDTPSDPTIPVEPRELVFNELLPNPFVGGSEYIELYNRSDHPLSLSGLAVATRKTDGTLSTRYPLSSVTAMIEPDHYALLTKNKAGVEDFYMIQSPTSLFEIPKLPILANTTSTLVLFRTSDDTVIDEVSYTSKWHAPSIKDQKGVALERIDPEAETQSSSNWTSAAATAGYGTPGYCNSQSEISSPDDPTGIEAPEWIPGSDHYAITYYLDQPGYSCRAFVYNPLGQRVAELANHELLGLTGQFTWDGSSLSGKRLRTGVYIFYAELYHITGIVKRYKQVFLVR